MVVYFDILALDGDFEDSIGDIILFSGFFLSLDLPLTTLGIYSTCSSCKTLIFFI